MSIKYLSPSGLTEVWSNIKTYIASKIPSKIITGLSIKGRTITYTNSDGTTGTLTTQDTDTTYTSMSAAEATTGTATTARSISAKVLHDKITSITNTKANDSDVVHKSGAETIAGLKTFSYWQIINMGLNVKWITGNKEQKSLFLFASMDDSYRGYGAELQLHTETLNGGFNLIAKDKTGTNVKFLAGNSNGSLMWDGKTVLTAGNGVTVDTAQTIAGTKTFSNVIFSHKELRYQDTKYDWTNTSLNTWCDAGHVIWFDKTGNRRMHELVGTNGGVWQKACYINENPYFAVNSNRHITYWGNTIAFNGTTTFTGNVICNGISHLKMTNLESNTTTPTSAQYSNIRVVANNGSQVGAIQFCKRADGSFDTTIYSNISGSNDGTLRITSKNEVYPINNNKTKLGISTAKWSEVWANAFSGNYVICTGVNAFMAQYGGYTFLIRNDGNNTYFLMSDKDGVPGTWSTARPLTISNATGICSINGNANTATNATYTNWLRTSSHTDHLFHTEWDGSYFWTYVTASDGGYRAVRVARSDSSGSADTATYATTQATSDNSTKIATTAWVRTYVNSAVGSGSVGATITAYWGSSSSTGDKWATAGGLNGTMQVSSTSDTFTPVVGQIYSGNQLYSTAGLNGGIGDTGALGLVPKVVYARLDLSGAFNSSYKYLCTTAVGVNAKASVTVTGRTAETLSGLYTTVTGYSGFTQTLQGGKSTFLRVQ